MDLSKLKILNLEWASGGRDPNIVEPVLSYLELKYNAEIIRDSIWYSPLKILKYRPDVLIVSNAVGSSYQFECAKFASKMGVYVIEMISEGFIYYENASFTDKFLFWGWNTDRVLYSDLILYWSFRAKEIVTPLIKKEYADKIVVGGATGFDRYKLSSHMNKEKFLFERKIDNYKKIVGIASYGFDLYFQILNGNIQNLEEGGYEEYHVKNAGIFVNACIELGNIYKELIESNPDILFVLKHHPVSTGSVITEFSGLEGHKNIIEYHHELPISDIINICDIWMAYDSTTCIEAWLLDKTTILVNPCEANFVRPDIYKGCVIAETLNETQQYINEYYSCGRIKQFEMKKDQRYDILINTINSDDGMNHIRTGEIIHSFICKSAITKKKNIDLYVIKRIIYNVLRLFAYHTPLKYLICKRAKAALEKENLYNASERSAVAVNYKEDMIRFYKENGVQI